MIITKFCKVGCSSLSDGVVDFELFTKNVAAKNELLRFLSALLHCLFTFLNLSFLHRDIGLCSFVFVTNGATASAVEFG